MRESVNDPLTAKVERFVVFSLRTVVVSANNILLLWSGYPNLFHWWSWCSTSTFSVAISWVQLLRDDGTTVHAVVSLLLVVAMIALG